MSSIVGHLLAGWTVQVTWQSAAQSGSARRDRRLWLLWLLVIAIAPDFDYLIPGLHPRHHQGLRITHALLSCQLLPALTVLWLHWRGLRRSPLAQSGLQASLAGFSHLALDLLVGVTALPLAWPLTNLLVKLPFGLLPSAGKLSIANRYLYNNLALELGVLLPWSYGLYFWRSPRSLTWRSGCLLAILLAISARCMLWAYHLSR
ncbi:MAG: hypothetical protein HC910_07190 [Spirulinaceae cyanobacterium SM2_1_0]|nr:hypothetical protein [Spirulinaceae cyanobacterium SM2_1_0]